MGDAPLEQEDPGRFPPQGGSPVGNNAAKEDWGGYVDISTARRGHEGSGSEGGGDCRNLLYIDYQLNRIDPSTIFIFLPNAEWGYRTKSEILLVRVFKYSIE